MRLIRYGVMSLGLMSLAAVAVVAADWPQWLGPKRDGSSPETGLLSDWPKDGPKVLWKVPGGDGYSSIAVVGKRAYTLVQRDADELAICLDIADGKELWKTRVGHAFKNSYGNGPRSTPAIDGEHAYIQSVTGTLACLKAESGAVVWQRNLLKDFAAKNITWGLSASPLIDGDHVLAIPGGAGAGVAAFDKKNGKLAWKLGDDKAAYASPIAVNVGGARQLVFFTAAGLVGVSPGEGSELWRMPWTTEFDCNIATPLSIGDKLFVSSGEDVGCAMLHLKGSGAPAVAWESKGKGSVMINYWANSVYHDGYLYGLAGEFSKVINLNCVDARTGKLMWSKKAFGKASVTLADGHLYLVTKKGQLVLAEATPKEYREKARITPLGENRTAATISNGRLFLRDRENILCLDVRK